MWQLGLAGIDSLAVSNTATLSAEVGRETGSAASRRLRAADRIPAVLYGHGMDPISLTVVRRDLRVAISGPAGQNTILTLNVDGKNYSAVIKELQRHPVRRNVAHIDFIQIDLTEEITMQVPVVLTGTAKAVVSAGGLVDPSVDTIAEMRTDSVIRLADVKLPAGVVATGDPDMPVATVLISRAATEAAQAATAAEAAPEATA